MYGWESSDQYVPDTETRYPQFSDMQLNDRSAGFYGKSGDSRSRVRNKMESPVPQFAHTREDQYLNGALGVPSYYQCNCEACPDHATDWPRRKPTRRPIRDNDMLSLALDGYFGPGYNCLGCPDTQTKKLSLAQRSANAARSTATNVPIIGALDNMTILLVFMFLILVFIVIVGGRELNNLRMQIKKLKNK